MSLDPATLRALAAEHDQAAQAYTRDCDCALHFLLSEKCAYLAADYRTRAIKAELASGKQQPRRRP